MSYWIKMSCKLIIAAVLNLALLCNSCDNGNLYCPGTPGESWIEGQLMVIFDDSVGNENVATEFIESLGLDIIRFTGISTLIAIVKVLVGEECDWMAKLNRFPEIDIATLNLVMIPSMGSTHETEKIVRWGAAGPRRHVLDQGKRSSKNLSPKS